MKQFVLHSDEHLFGTHTGITPIKYSENTYLLGDIVDIRGCASRHIAAALTLHEMLHKVFGVHYINGNHELTMYKNHIVVDNVYMTHGYIEYSGMGVASGMVNKPIGMNALKRWGAAIYSNYLRKYIGKKVNPKFIERAVKITKENGCDTYVCGHIHPVEIYDKKHDGIRIVVLPRGKTIISL